MEFDVERHPVGAAAIGERVGQDREQQPRRSDVERRHDQDVRARRRRQRRPLRQVAVAQVSTRPQAVRRRAAVQQLLVRIRSRGADHVRKRHARRLAPADVKREKVPGHRRVLDADRPHAGRARGQRQQLVPCLVLIRKNHRLPGALAQHAARAFVE
jgi:hypothetical protein